MQSVSYDDLSGGINALLLGAFAKMEYTFWTTVSKFAQMYAGLKYNP